MTPEIHVDWPLSNCVMISAHEGHSKASLANREIVRPYNVQLGGK
jgi:hypothetical protein